MAEKMRGHVSSWVLAETGRNEGPLTNERIAAVELDEEEEDIERDQHDGDDGHRPASGIVVTYRKHEPPPSLRHPCTAGHF